MIEINKKCAVSGCKNESDFILPFCLNQDDFSAVCSVHYQKIIENKRKEEELKTTKGKIKNIVRSIRLKIKDLVFELWTKL
jgi:hypothetical protein